ncbi:serine/threonine-protein kinase [Ideonella sp. A 288]|uniref:serine/threonine-protein kinase n=1 Tax=Ideonella sp. A 288 TaxID=1962181 RepID=UPI000B4B627F|nr:serine/threonine-protein kinase [Ideonella sp. A 288]
MGVLGFDAAQWPRLSALLDQALALPEAERSAWLAALPAEHADLRGVLQDMLHPVSRAGLTLPGLGDGDEDAWHTGDTVGPYRLDSLLGQGGMGSVWLAQRADGVLQRPVALKLPRAAAMRPGLAERMARERDLLASLTHPNIARLHDAGLAADGQPWLALELVAGERIDTHCASRGLDVSARLRLFLQAARAVAHAHARLIVHRDLKPSNLLVDGEGQVKLLDFGIAKLLDSGAATDSTLTRDHARPMTPDYAAPEQVAGQEVDTRADVYSLGVLLYELLSDTRLYRGVRPSAAAMEEAILHTEPVRPSEAAADRTVGRALRGDLDTIVLKALKKSPAERYPTVEALAEDIERHLDGRPVLARPDSVGYVLRKLLARHRLGFGAAGAALVAVLAGAGLALWQAHVAGLERERADQVKGFIVRLLHDANPYHGGDLSKVSAVDLLHQASQRLADSKAMQPAVAAELHSVVGEALMIFGDIAGADTLVDKAVAYSRSSLGDDHRDTLQARLVQLQMHRNKGRHDALARDLDDLLPRLRRRAADDPEPLVLGLGNLALHANDRGEFERALAAVTEAKGIAMTRLPETHPERIGVHTLEALVLRVLGRHAQARDAAEQALRQVRLTYGDQPHPRRMEALAMHGRALADLGDVAGGVAEIEAAAADGRRMMGADHVAVGMFLQNMVGYYIDLGRLDTAEARSAEALQVLGRHLPPEAFSHAFTVATRGAALLARQQAAEALAMLEPAIGHLKAAIGPAHEFTVYADALRVQALVLLGRLDPARAALPGLAAGAAGPRMAPHIRAKAVVAQAMVLRRSGDAAGAVALLQPLVDAPPGSPRARCERMRGLAELGHARLALGQTEAAAQAWSDALAEAGRLEVEPTPMQAEVRTALAQLAPQPTAPSKP